MTSCSPRSGGTTWLRCAPDSASRRWARLLPPLLRQESITGKIAASTPCSQGEYYSFYDSRAPVSPRGLSMTWHDRKSRPPPPGIFLRATVIRVSREPGVSKEIRMVPRRHFRLSTRQFRFLRRWPYGGNFKNDGGGAVAGVPGPGRRRRSGSIRNRTTSAARRKIGDAVGERAHLTTETPSSHPASLPAEMVASLLYTQVRV